MHRHARFDPLDQLVAPTAEQLAQGRQAWQRRAAQGGQALLQQAEGIAAQPLQAAVAPAPLTALAPAGECPEGIGGHQAPAADPLAPLHRFQQHAMARAAAHLQPGGEGGFQIGWPAAGQGDEVMAGSHLGQEWLIGPACSARAVRNMGAGHRRADGQKKRG